MCGIVGYIAERAMEDSDALLNHLAHRGPDDRGAFTTTVGNRTCFFGHTRLSILDLSQQGHQPMQTADGKITLIFNGEIYNYQELKQQVLKECSFRSNTDTEVLLHLYEKQGIHCLDQLIGDFALAILDERSGRLYLARDRCGIKPLYYIHTPTLFAFASELKPLLAMAPNQPLDLTNLARYFIFKYVPGQDTLLLNMKRLPPGHRLAFDLISGRTVIDAYWKLNKQSAYTNLNYRAAQETLYHLIRNATEMQLIADVPVGLFLSGGIDSSTLAYFIRPVREIRHYCARKSMTDLKNEGSSSDYYFADKLSQRWGLDLSAIDIGSVHASRDLIATTIFYSDDLIADGSQIPSYLIAREAGRTSRVLLSGMGGDELFYGYAGHQLSLLAGWMDRLPHPLASSIADLFSSLKPGRGRFRPYKRYLQKLGRYVRSGNLRYGFLNVVGDYANASSVFQGGEEAGVEFFRRYFTDVDDVFSAISRFEFDNFLVKNLHYMDRMCMAHSVEGRVPLLDYRLVEFAFSLPRAFKLSPGGRGKRILKDTMARHLPGYILKRRKAGFGMPLRSIFGNKKDVYHMLDIDFFNSYSGFSVENIQRIIHNHTTGLEDNSSLIYALISFEIWYKNIEGVRK